MKRAWDEKTRKRLADLVLLAEGAFISGSPPEVEGLAPDIRPVFRWRDFSRSAQSMITEAYKNGGVTLDVATRAMEDGEQNGVIGWDNVYDRASLLNDGEPRLMPFSKEGIRTLAEHVMWWLYMRIAETTWIVTEEKEGLASSPPSTSEQSKPDFAGAARVTPG